MDSKSLEVFSYIYKNKSIRKAASKLFLSPQAVSKILQNLESELGVYLFTRTTTGLIPTEAGNYFNLQASVLMQGMNQICDNIKNMYGSDNSIRMVCGYGTLEALPYEKIIQFEHNNPDIQLHWREYPDLQAEEEFRYGDYELALLVKNNGFDNEIYEKVDLLSRNIVVLVCYGHPLYNNEVITYEDLKNEPLIMEGSDFYLYSHFVNRCNENGIFPHFVAETSAISFSHRLCALKQGLTITVDYAAQVIHYDGIRAIPLEDKWLAWKVELLYKKSARLSVAASKLWNYLVSCLSNN